MDDNHHVHPAAAGGREGNRKHPIPARARHDAQDGIDLEITPEAVDALASLGYEPEFGARPLKRLMQREILNDLSKRILSSNISREGKIIVDYMGGNIVFRQPEEVGAS